MDGENGTSPGPGVRVLRQVVPWAALAVLVVTLLVIWSGFNASLRRTATSATAGGSVVATPTAESSATTVPTNTVAVTRVAGVKILSAASSGAKVLMTVKKGVTLQVLRRTDAWLRVREPDGLEGWIANSSKTVTVRKK